MTDFYREILRQVAELKARGEEPHGYLRELAVEAAIMEQEEKE